MSLCGDDCLVCRRIRSCIPDGHLHRVTYTRCCIDTINSPDDGHIAVRNMYRMEIYIHEKELCFKLVVYKDYTEMYGQQNIKFRKILFTLTHFFVLCHENLLIRMDLKLYCLFLN